MRRTNTHADEQHDSHERVTSQVVKMTDPARLSADAREFAIRVVNKVRQHDQKGARIGRGKSAVSEAKRACQTNQQTQRSQMIGRDPRVDERRD